MKSMRKYFMDNIRWATVLVVLIYHVFYIYNAVGIFGGIGGFYETQPWDNAMLFVYPWFMVLLYVIAGASAKYALLKQDAKQFMKSKVDKLLVPSTLGLLVLPAATGYIYISLGGSLNEIPKPLVYPISAISGTGPLWFLQVLFLFSWILTLLRKTGWFAKADEAIGAFFENGTRIAQSSTVIVTKSDETTPFSRLLVLIALSLPIWGASLILNMPVLTTYRFGIYFLSYLLGYFIFASDAVHELLAKWRFPLLILTVASAVPYLITCWNMPCSDDAVLKSPLTNLFLWLTVLTIFGFGKAYFDGQNALSRYMARTSFGIYIVHYLICLVLCLAFQHSGLPVAADYVLASVLTILLSVVVYEILRRIPVLRYVIFGIRKPK